MNDRIVIVTEVLRHAVGFKAGDRMAWQAVIASEV